MASRSLAAAVAEQVAVASVGGEVVVAAVATVAGAASAAVAVAVVVAIKLATYCQYKFENTPGM